ncbi:MarR family transcriptional regulator [Bacillus sp. FJAT-49711]|uniref:MarR family winged helix-turn-helix transcriptional regulator n=1 Tax=Bacillus sp. FJAT-49711 TaxID=2833585 RepID=UPI001BC9AB83|nr:MarR family transcriptional regulator [Bacillus sp. FJAT-49711]
MEETENLERFIDAVQYVGRMLKRNVRDQASPQGITKTQWFILRHLWKKACTIGELAEKLEVRSSSMSQMIDRMELAGLVQRTTDPQDGRTKIVMLSDEGKKHLETISTAGVELLSDPFSKFSKEEQKVVVELLERFKANLSAAFEEKK